MKYRIKVFPLDGQLLYMPQIEGLLWGYNDLFYYDDMFGWSKSSGNHYDPVDIENVMINERTCLDYIKLNEEKLKCEEATTDRIKKFQKENKIRYIEVNLDE